MNINEVLIKCGQSVTFMHHIKKLLFLLFLFFHFSALADIRLPRLISNGMILQRNMQVRIWGWSAAGENVEVIFRGKSLLSKADPEGNWEVYVEASKEGGPFHLLIKGRNEILVEDIWIGDVWVCSGQSNMELPLRRVKPAYEEEIARINNPYIRQFTVPQKYNFKTPQKDLESGEWKPATQENILDFSATAYFFAKNIYEKYHVPVGLINASLGGSPAQSWISEDGLKAFPEHFKEAVRFRIDTLIQDIERMDNERTRQWYQEAARRDQGYKGIHWGKDEIDVGHWKEMKVPGNWADTESGNVHGVVWLKRVVELPDHSGGKKAQLNLGSIVDADSVWINGVYTGSTTYMYPPRWYTFPANILRKGKNTITLRVVNERGRGGFVKDKSYSLLVDGHQYDLSGVWKYQIGTSMPALDPPTFIRWKPLGLYNAMIHPLIRFNMKGVIWYQGESNVSRAAEYRTLFPALIQNWRKNWNQGDFPFLYVQLANYLERKDAPSESDWALLREAQAQALVLPNTGMAVTIDIGEWNDIHPLNKGEVGRRLALAARRIAYGESPLVYTGPTWKAMTVQEDKIILSFNNTGNGLTSKSSLLKGFAIAGEDRVFRWGQASIKGNTVEVFHPGIKKPVAVRYAWADNPVADLSNSEKLPAAPFRTDQW